MFNNIDKALEGKGNNEETKRLADLEKIEFDVMQNLADKIKEDFERETKDKPRSFMDWLKSKPTEYFKRIELKSGGKVVDIRSYSKLKEPEIKKINLADYFEFGKTVASLTDAEKEVVNQMLQMSLGKGKE
ncbi:hypothetical protein N9V33_00290 [Candidatus Pelagibacter bacterium]|jgi:hypothetical protein|nr:hypothetical protein [Candidatus Pelagibacter bacterium]